MVYLLSQPVKSGKTTLLSQWILHQKGVAGILAPDFDQARWLIDITTNERCKLTLDKGMNTEEAVLIGRYAFSAKAFSWARAQLKKAFLTNPNWLVFDEIGYLELRGQGLEPMVRTLLRKKRVSNDTKFVWIVRDELCDEIIEHYKLAKDEWRIWDFNLN